jgi:ferredoxin-type protein NapH
MKQRISQILSTLLYNSYIYGFIIGTIYQGNLKLLNCPGFNCYSCPSAIFACPLGILQFFSAYGVYHISLYTLGLLGAIGAAGGRIICGWGCPFGLLQDLMYKIKAPKLNIPSFLYSGRYVTLILLVIIIPYFTKEPWFSKLCPVGTLEAGIPHLLYNADLRQFTGTIFIIKCIILFVFLVWMIVSKRPFCRTTCPLGAIYSLFNRISFLRVDVDKDKCIKCSKCHNNCPVSIKVFEDSGATSQCIRCLRCTDCPVEAISYSFKLTR